MADLRTYRINLGWSSTRLAHELGIRVSIVNSAERGEMVHRIIAEMIADTLSKAYGKEIKLTDIERLNIL